MTTTAYISPKEKERIGIVANTRSGQRMFDKLDRKTGSINTKIVYAIGCIKLAEYLKKGLDDIVNEYERDLRANMYAGFEKWEEIFDDFAIWLQKQGLGRTSVAIYHSAAKALINSNVPKSLKLRAECPEFVTRTIPGITIEDLREVYKACDERERAFISILKDSGMSRADALRLNYGDIRRPFEAGDQFIKINMFRGKEEVEYETWIGPNAIDDLKTYLTIRRNRGENITDETPIFVTVDRPYRRLNEYALSAIFERIEKRVGKKISTHRVRKFFETYISIDVPQPVVVKYWAGHKVRKGKGDVEARYIIPPENIQRQMYMKAYKNIDLIPRTDEYELFKADIKTRLEGMDPERRRRFITEIGTLFRERAGRLIEEPDIKALLEEKPTKTDGANLDCGEQFEQINEKELLDYLRAGWQVVHRLQNGEVIIRKG